jgi:pyruvate-formate lyase-activating enzyme
MNDEQKQKRLENLAKARARIIELREQKEMLSKSKEENVKEKPVEKPVEKMADEPEKVEKETPVVADTVDKEDDVKETKHIQKIESVKPIKKQKEYVKKEKKINPEPVVIQNTPVKLTFERGNDGFWYM